ncbi:hypothetical protein SDC9_34082 [bioreactor metagenome]|uniref:CDP-diacylglycerol--glycerol-3-phosphate 3-phosphatidyltransferase n=2 Tax=root TaxID=1 RepID=A0A644V9N8_9ZZZZ
MIYSLCGLTDILDGYIARKTDSVTNLGAKLDTIGDIVFMASVVIVVLPVIEIPKIIWIWIIIIFIIRIISMVISYYKYNVFSMLHTIGNKLTGFILFVFVYLYPFMDLTILTSLICILATYSSIEELIIHIKSKDLNVDVRGLF